MGRRTYLEVQPEVTRSMNRMLAAPLKFLALIGLLAILGAIGAATFFFGGFFDVGAAHADPDVVSWALIQVRKASIARHATQRLPVSLDDPALVRAGARTYS